MRLGVSRFEAEMHVERRPGLSDGGVGWPFLCHLCKNTGSEGRVILSSWLSLLLHVASQDVRARRVSPPGQAKLPFPVTKPSCDRAPFIFVF